MNPIDMGIDFGGTRIKCGLLHAGRVLASAVMPAPMGASLACALREAEAALRRLMHEQGVTVAGCRGVGMGFPALVDHAGRRVRNAYGKYDDAPDMDLVRWCGDAFNLPVAIENDARLALMGECRFGAGRGSDRCAIVTLGTGVGTAVLLDGEPLRGPYGSAGNLGGHLSAVASGLPCSCGMHGCYEAQTGSRNLPRILRETPGFAGSLLAAEATLDYEALFRCARQGDACAITARDRSLTLWARLCIDLASCFELDRVVLGGGVMRSASDIVPAIQRMVDAQINTPVGTLGIVPAEHPDTMALLGVPWLLDDALEESCTR